MRSNLAPWKFAIGQEPHYFPFRKGQKGAHVRYGKDFFVHSSPFSHTQKLYHSFRCLERRPGGLNHPVGHYPGTKYYLKGCELLPSWEGQGVG